ncbi:MAG: glycoside hydrolase, partial [Spirosomaceae bacterium]|nr:glycoside hydrolase [Spirosomataceae bacterium]
NALWQKHQADILDKVQGKGFVRNGQDENGQKQPMGYPLFSRIGWQTRHKPLQIGGKILLPLYSDGLEMSLVAMTEDFGKNWTYSEPIVGIANIQAALLPKNNGHIVAYMRDNGPPPQRLPVSTSTDGGLTWSDVTDSDLPNPGSGADAVRLANGHWALIGNDTDEGRHRLAVFLSEDEGKTWPYKRYLERTNDEKTGVRAHYPAIVQGQDGKLYACYTLQQNNQRTIRFAVFDEQWLKTPTQ